MKQAKRRKLSSRQTFFLKFIAPSLIILAFLFMVYMNWELEFAAVALVSMYTSIGIFLGIYLYFFRTLKNVWIDDSYLHVSNFSEDLKIPLSQIDRISEMKIFNPRRITIHLKKSGQFGNKIVFLGYHQQWLLFGAHPAVTIIQKKLDKLKS